LLHFRLYFLHAAQAFAAVSVLSSMIEWKRAGG
jgi:hypothetical protein